MDESEGERRPGGAMESVIELMRTLRDPQRGCPWDREQDFATIAPYTIEEAYEVADAIARADFEGLRDELGDLLFQVAFHSRMAEEQGRFDFADVARGLVAKMRRRHPHVFGDEHTGSSAEQSLRWAELKASERSGEEPASALSPAAGGTMGPLRRALELQRAAASVGFDWGTAAQVLPKIDEELGELRDAVEQGAGRERLVEEFGDLLFSMLNLARHLALDPELALIGANAKFERRFRGMEQLAAAEGGALAEQDPQRREALWRRVKRRERSGRPTGRRR